MIAQPWLRRRLRKTFGDEADHIEAATLAMPRGGLIRFGIAVGAAGAGAGLLRAAAGVAHKKNAAKQKLPQFMVLALLADRLVLLQAENNCRRLIPMAAFERGEFQLKDIKGRMLTERMTLVTPDEESLLLEVKVLLGNRVNRRVVQMIASAGRSSGSNPPG